MVALLAVNLPAAETNSVASTTMLATNSPAPSDPIAVEYQKLMDDDQTAMDEVDGWIRENREFAAKGAGLPPKELNDRIMKRLGLLRVEYEDFIKRHPNRADVRIAFASFLEDIGDEDGEVAQLEKARELDPKNPAAWNQLANFYGHNGSMTKAFDFYAKAIDLNSNESVYYQNLATTVFLYRKDAKEYYHIDEQQVFDKAMGLYAEALKRDPTNFVLACDVASSYYGIKPWRLEAALRAWTNAYNMAGNDVEREGVDIHLARVKIVAGQWPEAHAHLDAVTNVLYADIKRIVSRNLSEKEHPTADTNSPPTLSMPSSTVITETNRVKGVP